MKRLVLGGVSVGVLYPVVCFAWAPLITSTMFDGIRTDVETAAGGVLSIVLVVAGIGFLIRTFTR